MRTVDLVIIGGGSAGLSAAVGARKRGVEDILVLERSLSGGILRQCIHNGFGVHKYKEDLTGVEFAKRIADEARGSEYYLHVRDLRPEHLTGEGCHRHEPLLRTVHHPGQGDYPGHGLP